MFRLFAILSAVIISCSVASVLAETPAEWAAQHADELVEIYRQFHLHPELSSQETETAGHIAELWKEAGAEVHTGVGGTGVVGLIRNGSGPTLMLRTDLDALPVVENTGLAYASKVRVPNKDGGTTGVMHACGHDIHMTSLVGVARFLTSHKADWAGTIILVGQPAEERGEGARRMLDDGLFTRFPKPDMALACTSTPRSRPARSACEAERCWRTSIAST